MADENQATTDTGTTDAGTTDASTDTGAADAGATLLGGANTDSASNQDAGGENNQNTGGEQGDQSQNNGGDNTDSNNSDAEVEYTNFDLPEGVELDKAALEKASPIFKDLGLSKDQAQQLVTYQAEQMQAIQQQQQEAFDQTLNDWSEQSKNDKEIGGDSFSKNVGVAKAALDKFGTPELTQILNDTGMGNHPEVIRMLFNVGKLTQEDNPGQSGNAAGKEQSFEERLYSK